MNTFNLILGRRQITLALDLNQQYESYLTPFTNEVKEKEAIAKREYTEFHTAKILKEIVKFKSNQNIKLMEEIKEGLSKLGASINESEIQDLLDNTFITESYTSFLESEKNKKELSKLRANTNESEIQDLLDKKAFISTSYTSFLESEEIKEEHKQQEAIVKREYMKIHICKHLKTVLKSKNNENINLLQEIKKLFTKQDLSTNESEIQACLNTTYIGII